MFFGLFIGIEPSGAFRFVRGNSCSDARVGPIPDGQKQFCMKTHRLIPVYVFNNVIVA